MRLQHPWRPIEDRGSRVLVLGTMPSPASLSDGFYYGHPRNAFWPIMARLYGVRREAPPELRAEGLRQVGVAVWDVLRECERPGALDCDILLPVANDFTEFMDGHPRLVSVVFNGRAAASLFRRLVLPGLGGRDAGIRLWIAPSTSPAHARPFGDKLRVWRSVMAAALGRRMGA